MLIDSATQVIYVLTDFLPAWSLNTERSEVSTIIIDLSISNSSVFAVCNFDTLLLDAYVFCVFFL